MAKQKTPPPPPTVAPWLAHHAVETNAALGAGGIDEGDQATLDDLENFLNQATLDLENFLDQATRPTSRTAAEVPEVRSVMAASQRMHTPEGHAERQTGDQPAPLGPVASELSDDEFELPLPLTGADRPQASVRSVAESGWRRLLSFAPAKAVDQEEGNVDLDRWKAEREAGDAAHAAQVADLQSRLEQADRLVRESETERADLAEQLAQARYRAARDSVDTEAATARLEAELAQARIELAEARAHNAAAHDA